MADAAKKEENKFKSVNYTCIPSTLIPTLEYLLAEARLDGTPKAVANVMIWGGPGIGKTEIVRQVAAAWDYTTVALHLPQYDPTDIKGIAVRMDDGTVRWVSTSYLPQQVIHQVPTDDKTIKVDFVVINTDRDQWVRVVDTKGRMVHAWNNSKRYPKINMETINVSVDQKDQTKTFTITTKTSLKGYKIEVIEKALLFLDELSAADPGTQNAALQLVLDRRVNEYVVPEGVPIVAAGNREKDGAFVGQMSLPLANRFCHLTLEVSVTDFIAEAVKRGVHSDIVGHLNDSGSKSLYNIDPDSLVDGEYGFPTPRIWVKFSEQYDSDLDTKLINRMVVGYVGVLEGNNFINYVKVCAKLPSVEAILKGQNVDKQMHDLQKSAHSNLAMRLLYRLKDYYKDYYNPTLKEDAQSEEWKLAVNSMFLFVDKHMGDEIAAFIAFMFKPLGLRMDHLRSPAFSVYCDKHIKLFERVSRF